MREAPAGVSEVRGPQSEGPSSLAELGGNDASASTTTPATLGKGLGGGLPKLPDRGSKSKIGTHSTSNSAAADAHAAGGSQTVHAEHHANTSAMQQVSKAGPKLPPRKAPAGSTSASPASVSTGHASNSSTVADVSGSDGAAAAQPAPSTSKSTNTKPASKSSFMPTLPPRQAAPSSGPTLDPDEPPSIQKLRKEIHTIRVSLIRAAQRLGYDHENGLVKQVLYRLNLAEKLKAPWRKGKRLDPALAAAREASRLEQEEGAGAPLGFTVKMMLVGLTGSGKTQLIRSLLNSSGVGSHAPAGSDGSGNKPVELVDPFEGATKGVQVVEGTVHGIHIVCVDTPGLVASAGATAYNGKVMQKIRRACQKHKPDLVVYVDRLDSSARPGGELPALSMMSENLGPGIWLNTIVALSHAGSPPPCGPKGQMSFDTYANQRSHLLQQVIRSASGDNRLMNPTAFVESHPNCRLNSAGQAVIANGMPWKAHLYLMMVSAKLLADTENMLQMQDGSSPAAGASASASASAAAMQQMMMGSAAGTPRQLPLPYLISSLTQFSKPLEYPDHEMAMDMRRLEEALASASDPRQARNLVRQMKGRLLQLRQANANKERMQRSFKNATLAGGKVTPEPPRLATRRPPSVHPPGTYRYRVPEPTNGWIVRPHIESHGMDNSDGIEGLYLEKMAVAGRGTGSSSEVAKKGGKQRRKTSAIDQLLGGTPYHHYVSAQCNKEHKTIQARSEATIYHDPMGNTTSTVSGDVQTSGGAPGMPMDALCTLRADVRRKSVLGSGGKATMGMVLTRIAENGRPHKGPAAAGLRLQQVQSCTLPGSSPAQLSAALAYMTTLPGGPASSDPMMVGEREGCYGGNMELTSELQHMAGTRHSLPLTLGMNAIRYRGELMTGLAAALQYRSSRSEMVGGRLQIGNKGKAGLSVKYKSKEHWWAGLVAMALPLGTLLLQSVGVLR